MPSPIPGSCPPTFGPSSARGKGPFRWVALSGDPADLARTDDLVLEMFPDDEHLVRWIHLAREKVHFQGLPARICWLGQGERARFGVAMNDLVASGETQRAHRLSAGTTWTRARWRLRSARRKP